MYIIESIHFFFLSLLIISSLFLILSKNPVYSVLLLILVFFCSSAISILFGTDFLGILFVVIYVGAIAVLFLFVVMMLDLKTNITFSLEEVYRLLFITFFLMILYYFIMYYFDFVLIFQKSFNPYRSFSYSLDTFFNIDIFGQCIYNYFLPCFLIVGIILLLAMLGAITLTLKYCSLRKNQLVYKQLSRTNTFLSYFDSNNT